MTKAFGGLIVGIILGYILQIPTNEKIFAIIFLSALDAILGGVVSIHKQIFSNKTLIFGFLTNATFGLSLIFFGNFFEMELHYIAMFILGLRIFKNFSTMKDLWLKKVNV